MKLTIYLRNTWNWGITCLQLQINLRISIRKNSLFLFSISFGPVTKNFELHEKDFQTVCIMHATGNLVLADPDTLNQDLPGCNPHFLNQYKFWRLYLITKEFMLLLKKVRQDLAYPAKSGKFLKRKTFSSQRCKFDFDHHFAF